MPTRTHITPPFLGFKNEEIIVTGNDDVPTYACRPARGWVCFINPNCYSDGKIYLYLGKDTGGTLKWIGDQNAQEDAIMYHELTTYIECLALIYHHTGGSPHHYTITPPTGETHDTNLREGAERGQCQV